MHKADIILAWKDEEYRASLTDDERVSLPSHPSGAIELPDSELNDVGGAFATESLYTNGCCNTGWVCTKILGCQPTWYVITLGCCPEEVA